MFMSEEEEEEASSKDWGEVGEESAPDKLSASGHDICTGVLAHEGWEASLCSANNGA